MIYLGPNHRVAPWPCPNCGATLDAATSVEHADRPTPDQSLSVCAYCSQLLIFRADRYEKVSLKLYSSLPPQQRRLLMTLAKAAKQIRADRKQRN